MSETYTRREALGLGATAAFVGVAGPLGVSPGSLDSLDVRGAIYLPARAYNIYQMWANYDRSVVERDLTYAARLNLTAIRAWVSFEFWTENPKALGRELDHFLSTADSLGMRVLFGLFEGIGSEPTQKRLRNTNPLTATAVHSPSSGILRHPTRWTETRRYVKWFMDRYRDDHRLLAIEVMNEPGWSKLNTKFSHAMFATMASERGSVPLTVGSTSMVNNAQYLDWGADVLQFHYNFPIDRNTFRDALRQVKVLDERLPQPVWLTEWQRVRGGKGFHTAPPKDQRTPDYASMAPVIQEAGFGNFFWSLMLKPGYVGSQRKHGILSGIFHEDGAVWSRDDARAIKAMSGNASFDGTQRQSWPEWALTVKEHES